MLSVNKAADDTDAVYITCVDNTIPTRTVRRVSNNKPWINCNMNELLNKKKPLSWRDTMTR